MILYLVILELSVLFRWNKGKLWHLQEKSLIKNQEKSESLKLGILLKLKKQKHVVFHNQEWESLKYLESPTLIRALKLTNLSYQW